MSVMVLFFFRRKTAYEMLISDGSSDGCSSDVAETWRALDLGQALDVEILQRVERIRQQHRAAYVGDVAREIAQRAPAVYSPGLFLAYGTMAQQFHVILSSEYSGMRALAAELYPWVPLQVLRYPLRTLE